MGSKMNSLVITIVSGAFLLLSLVYAQEERNVSWKQSWDQAASRLSKEKQDVAQHSKRRLENGNDQTIQQQMEILKQQGSPELLLALLAHPSDQVKTHAARALGAFKTKSVAQGLLKRLEPLEAEVPGGTEAQIMREEAKVEILKSVSVITGRPQGKDQNIWKQDLEQSVARMPGSASK